MNTIRGILHTSLWVLALLLVPVAGFTAWNPAAYQSAGSGYKTERVSVQSGSWQVPVVIWSSTNPAAAWQSYGAAVEASLEAWVRVTGIQPSLETLTIVEDAELPGAVYTDAKTATIYVHPDAGVLDLAQGVGQLWANASRLQDRYAQVAIARVFAYTDTGLRTAGYGSSLQHDLQKRIAALRVVQAGTDAPLTKLQAGDLQGEAWTAFDAKATAFGFVLYAALGPSRWDGFIRRIAAAKAPLKTEGLMQAVAEATSQSAESLFRGWVFKGDYSLYSFSDFADEDNDGLPSILEKALNLHIRVADVDGDALSDGFEYWSGLNPRSRSEEEARNDFSTVGLAPDGLTDDWSRRRLQPIYNDAVGDSAGLDLAAVYAATAAGAFCVMAEFVQPPQDADALQAQLRLSPDWNGAQQVALQFDVRDGVRVFPGTSLNTDAAQGAIGTILEICLPASALPRWSRYRVNLAVLDRESGTVLDHMGAWWAPVN